MLNPFFVILDPFNNLLSPLRYGRSSTPWGLHLSPGGSSGGTAALVAALGSPAGLTADIGGSTRIPALLNGLQLRPRFLVVGWLVSDFLGFGPWGYHGFTIFCNYSYYFILWLDPWSYLSPGCPFEIRILSGSAVWFPRMNSQRSQPVPPAATRRSFTSCRWGLVINPRAAFAQTWALTWTSFMESLGP